VPLNLNKLDLRDYLWNGYGVRVKGVRSYIQQQKVRQDKPGAKRPAQRRWYRPRAIKRMMVELEEPFAWMEEPESLEPYVYPSARARACEYGVKRDAN
jgi:large subunit ribosomal protein L23